MVRLTSISGSISRWFSSQTTAESEISWLCAVLRGENPPALPPDAVSVAEHLARTALHEGVLALSHYYLHSSDTYHTLPEAFRQTLESYARQQAAREMLEQASLREVLNVFQHAGLSPLLLKGTPLAYTLYPQPHLRDRCDTDILFRNRDQGEEALRRLAKRGYAASITSTGELLNQERALSKTIGGGHRQTLDVHWKLCNAQYFSTRFSFDELSANAESVPRISADTRWLGVVHALFHACIHRMTHSARGEENRLIWLYDIHLLANSVPATEWERVVETASRKGLAGVCLDGLAGAQTRFQTNVPAVVVAKLQQSASKEKFQPQHAKSRWRLELLNIEALPTWGQRLRLIREHLLPPAEYMLTKYAKRRRLSLPGLYVIRIAKGLPKLLGHRGRSTD